MSHEPRWFRLRGVSSACKAVPLVAALVVFLLPNLSLAQEPSEAVHVGTLTAATPLFWDGGYVAFSRGQAQAFTYYTERAAQRRAPAATDPCKTKTSPCWLYSFDVTETATELRVSLDSASKDDCYGFEVIDPTGTQRAFKEGCPIARVGVGVTPNFGVGNVGSAELFNHEAFIKDPVVGTWQVKVVVGDVTDWAFRMRAALVQAAEEPELLAPNFTPWLPYQFGFAAPLNPRSGTSRENINPAGSAPMSCTWEETVDRGATRCLRFSSGVHNVGDGPFYLKFLEDDRAVQHTYYSDDTPGYYKDNEETGNFVESDAGSGEYHSSHGHRHVKDMVQFELFEVTDPAPAPPYDPAGNRLIPIGTGAKHGFCTFENQIGRWYTFNQDRHGSVAAVGAGCQTAMSLDKGWGDLYPWYVPGQYVDYSSVTEADGSMRPGFYLVRVTVDPADHILETDEGDNTGWAFIRVVEGTAPTKDRVVICDRGWGESPWHPHSESAVEPFWWTIQQSSPAPLNGEC
ncbi:MAG: hypothetical protein M3N53_02250 [Actinomycetota bacterium]|nr:hypothetical protein [Actinomycetota bacterium]